MAETLAAPDPRVGALPYPRIALFIGGDSRHFRFTNVDEGKLAAAVQAIYAAGASVMATTSRRTPAPLAARLAAAIAGGPGFLWDGAGPNPYPSMLACADAILVTADSVNMASEAAATGAPVHVYWPAYWPEYWPHGSHRRFAAFHAALEKTGASRKWRGALEDWSYPPVNATPAIAESVIEAFCAFRARSCGGAHNR